MSLGQAGAVAPSGSSASSSAVSGVAMSSRLFCSARTPKNNAMMPPMSRWSGPTTGSSVASRRQHPPKGAVDGEVDAMTGRDQLIDRRVDRGVLATDAGAGEETRDEVPERTRCRHRPRRRHWRARYPRSTARGLEPALRPAARLPHVDRIVSYTWRGLAVLRPVPVEGRSGDRCDQEDSRPPGGGVRGVLPADAAGGSSRCDPGCRFGHRHWL